jgi:tRNA threonylcarbamoyl adenosine modification protein YjeE
MKKATVLFDAEVTLEQMPEVAHVIYTHTHLSSNVVVTLEGQLGAGKTTLTRQLLRMYGVQEPVVSPTFNYMHIYTSKEGKRIYHFDLYRLPSLDYFLAAGFDEYLYAPESITLIEWPAIIEPLLNTYLAVTLTVSSVDSVKSMRHILIKEVTQ